MSLAPQAYPMKWPAAALALGVHAAFFLLLILTVSWQKNEAPSVAVDLWTDLPAPAPKVAPPPPPPPETKPAPKVEAKPEPVAAKPDIALKAKKPEKVAQPAPPKVDTAKLERERREKEMQAILQKQAQADLEQSARAQGQMKAAQEKELALYRERVINKIRPKVNRSACGGGNPELQFDVSLLPTGQLRNNPILRKSSGTPACDKAVEAAILQSEPLPVPANPDPSYRELKLNFKPND